MIFFSKNLKYLRKGRGITQQELASSISVKTNTISNYENEISTPDFKILGKIINIFDIDAHSIIYKNLAKNKETSHAHSASTLGRYNEKDIKYLFDMLDYIKDKRLLDIETDVEKLKTALFNLKGEDISASTS